MRELKVGLLGLGTVGSGVYRILTEKSHLLRARAGTALKVERVLVRDPERRRPVDVEKALLTTDPNSILDDPEIDVVVELLGGAEPARSYLERALSGGKQVVTANKEVIARHGAALQGLALDRGRDLFFEASVAGGIPVLRSLQDSLAGEEIESIYGIVNGTTNYILTAMTGQGRDYSEALAEAQEQGFAEADPTADVAGHDAARKLAILADVAFDARIHPDEVYCEGITELQPMDIEIAGSLGYAVKLLAVTRRREQGVEVRVHPVLLPLAHPLAKVDGVNNAVLVEGWAAGTLMYYGAGAGQMPTASAVVGDIVAAAGNLVRDRAGSKRPGFGTERRVIPMAETLTRYYLRLRVAPEPGVLGAVTRCCSEAGVDLFSLDVKSWTKEDADLVLRTRPMREGSLYRFVEQVEAEALVYGVESFIRIEGAD